MNVEEKVATLEALLVRVKNNAARPRIPRPAEAAEPIGGARLAAPEPAVAALKAPDEKRVEKVAPARIEPPATPDALDAQLDKLLQPTIEKPVEARVEKPVEARVEKPVAAKVELLDVWTDALKDEVPKAAVAPPIVAPMAAKVDGGTPKAAPIAARSITPAIALPAAVRSTAPAARPVAPRPFGAKTEVTPSPAPTAAKVVEKIAPAITPPKAVEKVAPIVAASKPVEKVAPIVAASKPVEKITPIVAEKVETIPAVKVADEEIRFDIEAPPPLPKTPETKAAEPPAAAAFVATPVKVPPLPVVASKATPDEDVDEHVTQDDETVMLHGSIPEATPPIVTDETTTDEETIVSLPTSDDIAAKAAGDIDDDEPTTDASSTIDNEEPTHVFDGRVSRPEAGSPATVKIDLDDAPASKSDQLKVVVSPSVRTPITADAATATATTDEPVRAIKITEAVPAPRASDSGEATAPSRRYSNPDADGDERAQPPVPIGKRPSALMLGLVAAALIGAGVFVGLRNGWFEGSSTPTAPTAPTTSGPAPTASTAPITTASAAPTAPATASTPVPTTSAVVAPTDSASAVPSASVAPTASVAPSVPASSAPTAALVGDGTALPPNRGYVVVTSSKPASVFLTGNFAGLTGAKLEVECGAKFLRLAAPIAAGTERPATPDWTSEGRSISVVCRSTTTVALEATR